MSILRTTRECSGTAMTGCFFVSGQTGAVIAPSGNRRRDEAFFESSLRSSLNGSQGGPDCRAEGPPRKRGRAKGLVWVIDDRSKGGADGVGHGLGFFLAGFFRFKGSVGPKRIRRRAKRRRGSAMPRREVRKRSVMGGSDHRSLPRFWRNAGFRHAPLPSRE